MRVNSEADRETLMMIARQHLAVAKKPNRQCALCELCAYSDAKRPVIPIHSGH